MRGLLNRFTRKRPLGSYASVSTKNNSFSVSNPVLESPELTELFNLLFEAERKHSTKQLEKLYPKIAALKLDPAANSIIDYYFDKDRTPSNISRISNTNLNELKKYVKSVNLTGGRRRSRRQRKTRRRA